MHRIVNRIVVIWCVWGVCTDHGIAQQVVDENFSYPVASPTYRAGNGPLILFDEAHHNASTLRGAYSVFGKLLSSDGYNVVSSHEKVSLAHLENASIYVTVNAMYDMEDWNLPARTAFSPDEIDQLVDWVAGGGSLFLVTDHMPCGAAVAELAARFGINVINGFALRTDGGPEVFSRARKTLLSTEITGPPGREIDSILCWGGTGFIVPPHSHVISLLDHDYRIYLPTDVGQIKRPLADTIPTISGVGLANGAYLEFGKGRVVVFGDGAPFTAQLQGVNSEPRGMNHPGATQHVQFLFNIIHWLDWIL